MKHILFSKDNAHTNIALLIKESSFSSRMLEKHYIVPLEKLGLNRENIIALSLKYTDRNKAPVSLIKEHLDTLLKACRQLNITTLFVADTAYFKTLTKLRKAEPHYGYVKDCAIEHFTDIKVILSVNYQALFHNARLKDRLTMSLNALAHHEQKTYQEPGTGIIHNSSYPKRTADIKQTIQDLHKHKVLTCDIETFGLDLDTAGIATIAFAWGQHEGTAFAVDLGPTDEIKYFLREFFTEYKGKLIYHNGTFDIKMIIYSLFMRSKFDPEGLHLGLDIMYRDVEDTKIITYLATNNAQGNDLSLKFNAFEFAGNYAIEEIDNIKAYPIEEVLEYNLVDALSTWYVYNKYWNQMIQDNQLEIYENIFKPSMRVITHMELVGMPMDKKQIQRAECLIVSLLKHHKNTLANNPIIKKYIWKLQQERFIEKNLLLKKKHKPIEDFYEPFNPGSTKQVQGLLYEELGLPIIDTTDSGAPAVGGKTLQKLLNKLMIEHNITEEDLK